MSNKFQASKLLRQQIKISFFSSAKAFALAFGLVFFAAFAVMAQTSPRPTTPPTTNPPNPQQQQQQRPENEIRQNTAPQNRTAGI